LKIATENAVENAVEIAKEKFHILIAVKIANGNTP
jgi:hypothetical protein